MVMRIHLVTAILGSVLLIAPSVRAMDGNVPVAEAPVSGERARDADKRPSPLTTFGVSLLLGGVAIASRAQQR